MYLDGNGPFRIENNYDVDIDVAINWKQWSDGNYRGRDRGATNDVHSTTITFVGDYDEMTDLVDQINTYRSYMTVTLDVGEEIFGPHVDISGSIDVVVDDHGEIKRKNFTTYTLTLKLSMVGNPTMIAGTVTTTTLKNDLYSLKSIEYSSQDIGMSYTTMHKRSMTGDYNYADQAIDTGTCKLTISDLKVLSAPKMGLIVKAILTQLRSGYMSWPGSGQSPVLWGPTEPFGPRSPTMGSYGVKIPKWKLKRAGPTTWILDATFVEHVFNHDGS